MSWWTGRIAQKDIEAEFLSRAKIIAGAINPSRITSLKGSEEDLFLPDYHRLKEQLWLVRQVMPQYGTIYLLGKRGDEIFFYVDSEVPGSDLHSPPGKIYKDADTYHRKVFLTGKDIVFGPYTDRWGKWMTAIVPIYNRDTMELISLLCLDVDSREWSMNVLNHMLAPILFTCFISLMLFLYSIFHRYYDRAQRRIATSEEYMQLAIEGAGIATWEWDLGSGSIISNERFAQLLGYEDEELRVKLNRWHHLVHPDEKDHLQSSLEENLYGKASFFEEEHRLKSKKGEWVWVLNKGRVMERTKDGLPLRIAGTIMDISERKMKDRALMESEARFRRIFEESPIGIELYNSEGMLLEVNRACMDIFGVADASSIKGFCAYNDPNLQAAILDSIVSGQTTHIQVVYDFDIIKKTGYYQTNRSKPAFLDIFISSIDLSENAEGSEYLVHIQDITEKRIAEDERLALEKRFQSAQKMESLGLLAGGVAHDFNNILGALQGFAEMALEIVEDKLPDSQARDYLGHVLTATNRASALVEQILTFSRKTDSVRKPLDISVVAKETIKLLKPSIPSNIKVESSISQNCGRVLADPVQIHQVIMNLCTNARQAMTDNGGVLKIELSRSDFGEKNEHNPDAEYIRLTVSDTGSGIVKDYLERVFDPFFTTKKPGEGTGLGLSVVHGIVVSCDGYIMVESIPGKGSSFYVYLPEAGGRDEAKVIVNEEKIKITGRAPRIMLVDGERILLGMINERLVSRGFDVTSFFDPKSAMDYFVSRPQEFDIVISDSRIACTGASEFINRIRTFRHDMPLILMEGKRSGSTVDTCTDIKKFTPQVTIISKPIFFSDLFDAIKTLLGQGTDSL